MYSQNPYKQKRQNDSVKNSYRSCSANESNMQVTKQPFCMVYPKDPKTATPILEPALTTGLQPISKNCSIICRRTQQSQSKAKHPIAVPNRCRRISFPPLDPKRNNPSRPEHNPENQQDRPIAKVPNATPNQTCAPPGTPALYTSSRSDQWPISLTGGQSQENQEKSRYRQKSRMQNRRRRRSQEL